MVLGSVDLLDLAGVLHWSIPRLAVLLGGLAWTTVIAFTVDHGGEYREEISRRAVEALELCLVLVVGGVALGTVYPDASTHYQLNATELGQIMVAAGHVLVYPTVLLVTLHVLGWLEGYRQIRSTTPEERVLNNRTP